MRKAIAIILVCFLIGAPTVVLAAKVTAVPAAVAKKWDIDTKFYKKYTTVVGIPIIASAKVDSRALTKAAAVTRKMLLGRQYKIAKYLKQYKSKIGIIGIKERTSQMPEARGRGSGITKKNDKRLWAGVACCGTYRWDSKKRKWLLYYRTAFGKEPNVRQLGYPSDRYAGESVVMHEFAHVIKTSVLMQEYKSVEAAIKKSYAAAKKKGKYKKAYAMTNTQEYFATGTNRWFNTSYRAKSGFPKNREALKKYDPTLYNYSSQGIWQQ